MAVSNMTETYQPSTRENADYAVMLKNVSVYYGTFQAVKDVTIPIERGKITAFIGPSGCGKSTVLRVINRMNDLIDGSRVEGEVLYRGRNLYDKDIDPVEVRRRIGMVFQKPNPFPKSIYDNVAYGPRLLGINKKKELDEIVEKSLRGAALWEEVKTNLKKSGMALSGGQQQRLCIARAIAIEPDVILMDEPAASLDPIATQRIEQLMREELAGYTIVIVTHNMQQAERASDNTCFFNIRTRDDEHGHSIRWGELVEMRPTEDLFNNPYSQETNDYINGRFG
jgi:phosphate transport system ATP-binding protein